MKETHYSRHSHAINKPTYYILLALDDHDTTRHGTAQHVTARHGTSRHGTAQHGTTQHGTTQHGTAQHDTPPHGTPRHSTPQHTTARHGTAMIVCISRITRIMAGSRKQIVSNQYIFICLYIYIYHAQPCFVWYWYLGDRYLCL